MHILMWMQCYLLPMHVIISVSKFLYSFLQLSYSYIAIVWVIYNNSIINHSRALTSENKATIEHHTASIPYINFASSYQSTVYIISQSVDLHSSYFPEYASNIGS